MDYRIYNRAQLQEAQNHSRENGRELIVDTIDVKKTKAALKDSMNRIGSTKYLLR